MTLRIGGVVDRVGWALERRTWESVGFSFFWY